MEKERLTIYNTLSEKIGNTSLYEISKIEVPNNCKIFAKEEYLNPSGSHYDRVYLRLLKSLEEEEKIVPGKIPLIETSSGNASSAFAYICKELGYECEIILPENLPENRVKSATQYGAKIRFSPADKYIKGAAEMLKHVVTVENKERKKAGLPKYWSPNHSQDFRTIKTLEKISEEALQQLGNTKLDFFIGAIRNGASILGPGTILKKRIPKINISTWEPFASGLMFELKNPGNYEQTFGIPPGSFKHTIYGTGVPDVKFPFIKESISLIDQTFLVDDEQELEEYKKLIKAKPKFEKFFSAAESLTKYESVLEELHKKEKKPVGRSSAASLAIALELAKQEKNKNFLIIFYDPITKY